MEWWWQIPHWQIWVWAVRIFMGLSQLKLKHWIHESFFTDGKIGVSGLKALSGMLMANDTLLNLDLGSIHWKLNKNTMTYHRLEFIQTGNEPGTEGIGALSEALKFNTRVRELDLRSKRNAIKVLTVFAFTTVEKQCRERNWSFWNCNTLWNVEE